MIHQKQKLLLHALLEAWYEKTFQSRKHMQRYKHKIIGFNSFNVHN